MEARPRFWDVDSLVVKDATCYRLLLGKLMYLTMTWSNIVNVVRVLCKLMQDSREVCWSCTL